MTLDEIKSSYKIEDGIIRSPGKFEAEPIYAPYFWDATMDGCAEELAFMEDGCGEYVALVEINDEDRAMFPDEIDPADKFACLTETDNGFVYCQLVTAEKADMLRDHYAALDDEMADEDDDCTIVD